MSEAKERIRQLKNEKLLSEASQAPSSPRPPSHRSIPYDDYDNSDMKSRYLVTPKLLQDKYPNNCGGELEFKVTRHDITLDDPELQKLIKQRQKEEEEREAKLNNAKPGVDPCEGLSGLELSIARYELERKKAGFPKFIPKKNNSRNSEPGQSFTVMNNNTPVKLNPA